MLDNRRFIIAGKAVFTVDNGKGQHFTYRVGAPKPDSNLAKKDNYFLSVLTGPDNTKDFTYMGLFDAHRAEIISTKSSKFGSDALSWQVAQWILKLIWSGRPMPEGYTLNHEGRCGRCGRVLTTPESCETGIGPECAAIMGITWGRHPQSPALQISASNEQKEQHEKTI